MPEVTWERLESEALADLDETEFEALCFSLVQYEAYQRHDRPKVHGPTPDKVQDGGRDILIDVRNPPLTKRAAFQQAHGVPPLSEDDIGETAYSCKTGQTWLKSALKDAKDRGQKMVDVLAAGGYVKLLINRTDALDKKNKKGQTPIEQLRAAYQERLGKATPADLGVKLDILNAHDLAEYLRNTHPQNLVARFGKKLGVVPTHSALTFDHWKKHHTEDRSDPEFVWDATRTSIRDRLITSLSRGDRELDERVVWLIGPSGIGKTRLLIEVFEAASDLANDAAIYLHHADASDQIASLVTDRPNALIVVDDCPELQVRSLNVRFRAAAVGTNARLLLLTPTSSVAVDVGRIRHTLDLKPLDDSSLGRLIADRLGRDEADPMTRSIARLCEGYPWFAELLCQEARRVARAPENMAKAVDWVLLPGGQDEDDDRVRRDARARCLLAISLTARVDWDTLDEHRKAALAYAVGIRDFRELWDVAQGCLQRGLIRRQLGWHFKYVTPAILEREILKRLFGPDGPPGTRHAIDQHSEWAERFYELLTSYDLDLDTMKAIAQPLVAGFKSAEGWDQFNACLGQGGQRLQIAARSFPAEIAEILWSRIEATSIETLRTAQVPRRPLVRALESIASRKQGFEAAERALFRLALAENETYGNNASTVWALLFHLTLNTTHRLPNDRLELLQSRLTSPSEGDRLLALSGLQMMLRPAPFRSIPRPQDGAWPRPSPTEVNEANGHAWRLLGPRLTDEAPDVAAKAWTIACESIRDAAHDHQRVAFDVLADKIQQSSASERTRVRAALGNLRTFDGPDFGEFEGPIATLEKLAEARTVSERLRGFLGSWDGPIGPDAQPIYDRLARELLEEPTRIVEEIAWLRSSDAARALDFAPAFGRADAGRHVLDILGALKSSAIDGRLIASYALGWADTFGTEPVRDFASKLALERPELAAYVLVTLGPDDAVTTQLALWVRSGMLDEDAMSWLGWRGAFDGASIDSVLDLIDALDERRTMAGQAAALRILVARHPKIATAAYVDRLQRLFSVTSAEFAPGLYTVWRTAGRRLIELGRCHTVASRAIEGIVDGAKSDALWAILHEANGASEAAVWDVLKPVLEATNKSTARLLLAFEFHRQPFAWPTERVLEWVGDDEVRGRRLTKVIRPWEDPLHPVLVELIQRFGPAGSPARWIQSRLTGTDGVVSSYAEQDAKQLERSAAWAEHGSRAVREFAASLRQSLERQYAYHLAEEEDEKRATGT